MKKIIASLLMLCLITVVVPPVPNDDNGDDYGFSTYSYILQEGDN